MEALIVPRAAPQLEHMPRSSVPPGLRFAGLALLCAAISGCAALERWGDAARLVSAVAASEPATNPAPAQEVSYGGNGRRYRADLYPAEGDPRAALVLVHGFTEHGKADPQLRQFAASLAQADLQVLVPEIPGLTRLTVGSADIEAIAASLAYLAEHSELRRGLAAISYSVGPAVLAAMDKEPGAQFLLAVGGYYDLVEAISFATTGQDALGSPAGAPNELGRWLILTGHASQMPNARDAELLRRIARRRLGNPDADIADLRMQLSAHGRSVLALAVNRDPDRVAALAARLPASLRREIATLDLAHRDLSALDACLVLVHGAHDPMIPATHSIALAEAMPPGQAELFVVSGLGHVDVQAGLADVFVLWRAAVALLDAAQRC